MEEYELLIESINPCGGSAHATRTILEIETDDPENYVRSLLKGKNIVLTRDDRADGGITIYASCDGIPQKFIFTPI